MQQLQDLQSSTQDKHHKKNVAGYTRGLIKC